MSAPVTSGAPAGGGFVWGFGLLWQGFREAYTGPRRIYALVPLAINLVLFGLATWLVIDQRAAVVELFMDQPEVWYMRWLYWLAQGVVIIVLGYLLILLFPVLGAVVAAPFLDLLSEKLEEEILGRPVAPPFSVADLVGDVLRAASHALKGLLLGGACALLLLLLNLLPGIGAALYAVLNAALAALFLALQFLDYPAARRRISYGAKLAALRSDLGGSLGFGLALLLCTVVPGISAVYLAPAACAGTRLYHGIASRGGAPLDLPQQKV